MKKYQKNCIFFVCALVIGGLLWIFSTLFFYNEVSKFRTEVLFNLSESTTNIQCIPYEYLDEKYMSTVSKKQYSEANTPDEVMSVLQLFNDIAHTVESTTSITTDGWKTYPEGIVEVDGVTYEIRHHIDFAMKNFKPLIVRWCVNIEEVE